MLPGGPVVPGGPGVPFGPPAVVRPVFLRQTPELLGPDESHIATVRFATPCYVFKKDFTSVLTLKTDA